MFFFPCPPPSPKVTKETSSEGGKLPLASPCKQWVLSLAANNHFDPSRTGEPLGISQPVSSSTSTPKSPRHFCTMCSAASVRQCTRLLKTRLCLLLKSYLRPSREGSGRAGWEAVRATTTQSTHLCNYLQVLGCFLQLYCPFSRGCQLLPPQGYTISIHMQWINFEQFLNAITVRQSTCFLCMSSA